MLHPAYIREVTFLQALQKCGVLPVTGVGYHHFERYFPLARTIQ
jgi:hypothetical protein